MAWKEMRERVLWGQRERYVESLKGRKGCEKQTKW